MALELKTELVFVGLTPEASEMLGKGCAPQLTVLQKIAGGCARRRLRRLLASWFCAGNGFVFVQALRIACQALARVTQLTGRDSISESGLSASVMVGPNEPGERFRRLPPALQCVMSVGNRSEDSSGSRTRS